MNIVFTDIDGVVNPHWKNKWCPKAVAVYCRICKDFDLKPVITSTWRLAHNKAELQEIFRGNGIDVEILDFTPHIDQADRGVEIKSWLDNNEWDSYVVLDDKTSDIVGYVDNVVKCRSWIGLTQEEYDEVVKLLAKQWLSL